VDELSTDEQRARFEPTRRRRLAAGVGAVVMGYGAVFGTVYGGMVASNCVFGCAPPTARDLTTGAVVILAAGTAGAGAAALAVMAVDRWRWRRPAAGIGAAICVVGGVTMALMGSGG
jgi:hypothetical protein